MNQTIGVNITPQSFQPTLHYSQGDVGRVFVINVTDYDIPTGATVTCVATKPSGMGFTVSGTVSGNSVTFTSTAEMTDEWGRFPAEIRIASGNTLLGTANFLMIGEKDPHPASTIDGTQEELIPQLTLLVNRVEAAAESVHDLTVSATTLTAGSDATATYDSTNNSIAFGIPRGADGDVTRSEFNDLKSGLFSLGESFEELDSLFIRGSLSNTGEINNYTSRIVTRDILNFDYPIFLKKMDSSYNFRIALYDENDTFTAFPIGWTDAQYFLPANTHFRLTIAKAVETSDPADIGLFRTKVLKQTNYNYFVDSLLSYESADMLDRHIKKHFQCKYYNASVGKFVIGGYETIDLPLYYPFDIIIKNANSSLYMFNVKTFSDKEPVGANYIGSSGWKTDSYQVPKNTYFTVEYTTKDASVAPFPSIGETVDLLSFTPVGMASNIVYGAVDAVIRENPGFYSNTGYIIAQTSTNQEVYTQKYPTQKGMGYNVSLAFSIVRTMWGAYALYDENENFISRTVFANENSAKKAFDIVVSNDNAAYISFCYRTYGDLTINIKSYDFNKFSTRGVDLLDRKTRLYDYSVNEHIKSINHRGYNMEAPENTLPAYKLSKQYGFKYVECDVSFTSDDVPVLLHDATINRTARNADGTAIADTIYIESIAYEQALTYDFGIWKGSRWAGVSIPTFEQFITLCRNIGLHPYIEIKEQGMTEAHVNQIVDIVRNCGMANDVTWISFLPTALQYVLVKNPKARIGLLANTVDATVIATAQGLITNDNNVFVNSGSYTNAEVALCQNANIPMEVWNFADWDVIASLPVYVSGITSDNLVGGYVLYQKNISV